MIDKTKIKQVAKNIAQLGLEMAEFGVQGTLYNTLEASEARKVLNRKAAAMQAKIQVKLQLAKNKGVNVLGKAYQSIEKHSALLTAISAVTSLNVTKPEECPGAIMKLVNFVAQFESNVTQSVQDQAEIVSTVTELTTALQEATSLPSKVPDFELADGTTYTPSISIDVPSVTIADIQAVAGGTPLTEDESVIAKEIAEQTSDPEIRRILQEGLV